MLGNVMRLNFFTSSVALHLGLICSLGAVACSESDEPSATPRVDAGRNDGAAGTEAGTPPSAVVNEQKTHASSYDDPPFQAETVTLYRTTQTLPDLDVRALLVAANTVWWSC